MADCYLPEADDLHRRWLPREIFADIGIVDPDPIAAAAKPEVAVEELAMQLAGIIGAGAGTDGKVKSAPKRAPPPPPPVTPAAAPCHRAPVYGLEEAFVVAYGGGNVVAGGAADAWPVPPYPPLQWQVASNYASLVGGAPGYPMLPPAPLMPGATKLRGGTGVFLPRPGAYRHTPPPAKDGKAPSPRTWPGTARPVVQQKGGEAGAGKSQQNGVQLQPQKPTAAAVEACCPEVALALPQEWSYQ